MQYSSDAPDASLCYWTTVDEANRITTLNDYMDKLALSKDWGNRNTVKVARIPAGIEVKYAVGTAREQLLIADPRPGGGVQYLFNQLISTAAMGVIFLQLYNPSYGINSITSYLLDTSSENTISLFMRV